MPPLSVGEEEKGVMEGRECSSEVRAAFHQSPQCGELEKYCATCPKPHTVHL